jgi:hypothetical protein
MPPVSRMIDILPTNSCGLGAAYAASMSNAPTTRAKCERSVHLTCPLDERLTTRLKGHHQQKFRFPRRSGSIPSCQTERRQGSPASGDGRFDPVTYRGSSRFPERSFARRLTTWDPFMVRSGRALSARQSFGRGSIHFTCLAKTLSDSFSKPSACLISGPVRFPAGQSALRTRRSAPQLQNPLELDSWILCLPTPRGFKRGRPGGILAELNRSPVLPMGDSSNWSILP